MEPLDPKTTALVVIDLQKGIASMGRNLEPYTAEEVIANSAKLAEACRSAGSPVFLIHVAPSPETALNPPADWSMWRSGKPPADWDEFVPEMEPEDGDTVVLKQQWGAFYGTDLDLQLRRRGIETIVLCGIATSIGVESTARFAYEYGYAQVFAEDAMTSMSEEEHRVSVDRIFTRMGRVRKTAEIVENLS